jgi:hypothetical protein
MSEFIEPSFSDIVATLQMAVKHGEEDNSPPFKNEVEALLHKYRNN